MQFHLDTDAPSTLGLLRHSVCSDKPSSYTLGMFRQAVASDTRSPQTLSMLRRAVAFVTQLLSIPCLLRHYGRHRHAVAVDALLPPTPGLLWHSLSPSMLGLLRRAVASGTLHAPTQAVEFDTRSPQALGRFDTPPSFHRRASQQHPHMAAHSVVASALATRAEQPRQWPRRAVAAPSMLLAFHIVGTAPPNHASPRRPVGRCATHVVSTITTMSACCYSAPSIAAACGPPLLQPPFLQPPLLQQPPPRLPPAFAGGAQAFRRSRSFCSGWPYPTYTCCGTMLQCQPMASAVRGSHLPLAHNPVAASPPLTAALPGSQLGHECFLQQVSTPTC